MNSSELAQAVELAKYYASTQFNLVPRIGDTRTLAVALIALHERMPTEEEREALAYARECCHRNGESEAVAALDGLLATGGKT